MHLVELPDLDFDYVASMDISIGTKLSMANGKPHPVGYSLVDLPFPMTKESCNRMGVPHVDLLPLTIIEGLDLTKTLTDIEHLVPRVVGHSDNLYHIGKWGNALKQAKPKTVNDLARFIGIIRPKVRQMFLKGDIRINWECGHHCDEIIFQEDMIGAISAVYNVDMQMAEHYRKNGLPDNVTKDQTLLKCIYNSLNKHLMAKGHCLQVAYIILLQVDRMLQ